MRLKLQEKTDKRQRERDFDLTAQQRIGGKDTNDPPFLSEVCVRVSSSLFGVRGAGCLVALGLGVRVTCVLSAATSGGE